MKAEKMRLLAMERKQKRNERIRNKIERKKSTNFDKIYYRILMLRISVRAFFGKTSIQINGPISNWIEIVLKNEGYSIYAFHTKIGKILYTVIRW